MEGHNDPFGDHNVDVIHERTASGRGRPATAAHRTMDAMEVVAGRLTKATGGTLNLVLDEAGDWAAVLTLDDQSRPVQGYGGTHDEALGALVTALRPHVASQEDDGEQD